MPLNRVVIYVRDVEISAAFYETHFGFSIVPDADGRIVELVDPDGGSSILLHKAAKRQKLGQASVKLVFDIADIETFRARSAAKGLDFGPVHQADHYQFANAMDSDGNPIQISSRAYRQTR